MNATHPAPGVSGVDERLRTGMGLGLGAGSVFIIFEMVVAGIFGSGPFGPVRMISAIFLGPGALEPVATVAPLVGVGLLIHFLLSAVYGGAFATISGAIGLENRGRGALVAVGAAFGLVLWVVNFYLISPPLFPWFTTANLIVQLFAHTLFFGIPLGLLATGKRPVPSAARRVR